MSLNYFLINEHFLLCSPMYSSFKNLISHYIVSLSICLLIFLSAKYFHINNVVYHFDPIKRINNIQRQVTNVGNFSCCDSRTGLMNLEYVNNNESWHDTGKYSSSKNVFREIYQHDTR